MAAQTKSTPAHAGVETYPRMSLTVERISQGERIDALRELQTEIKALAELTNSKKLVERIAHAYWITKGLLLKEGER